VGDKLLQIPEALFRTRTGDPFVTIREQLRVAAGRVRVNPVVVSLEPFG